MLGEVCPIVKLKRLNTPKEVYFPSIKIEISRNNNQFSHYETKMAKRNFQVALTLGNAKGIDLFATNQKTNKTYEIEVKTLRKKPNCFTLKFERVQREKIFIFVYLNELGHVPDFFLIKGEELLENPLHFYGASFNSKRQTVNHGPIKIHHNCWNKLD